MGHDLDDSVVSHLPPEVIQIIAELVDTRSDRLSLILVSKSFYQLLGDIILRKMIFTFYDAESSLPLARFTKYLAQACMARRRESVRALRIWLACPTESVMEQHLLHTTQLFPHLPLLEILQLSIAAPPSQLPSPWALAEAPWLSLKSFRLHQYQCPPLQLTAFLNSQCWLQHLELSCDEPMAKLPHLPKLVSLKIPESSLALSLAMNPSIVHLCVSFCGLESETSLKEQIPELDKLVTLSYSGSFGPSFYALLARAKHLGNLELDGLDFHEGELVTAIRRTNITHARLVQDEKDPKTPSAQQFGWFSPKLQCVEVGDSVGGIAIRLYRGQSEPVKVRWVYTAADVWRSSDWEYDVGIE